MCEPTVPENSVDRRPGPSSIAGLEEHIAEQGCLLAGRALVCSGCEAPAIGRVPIRDGVRPTFVPGLCESERGPNPAPTRYMACSAGG